MPERFARLAALALVAVLILALPLLFSLFALTQNNAPMRTPTRVSIATQPPATSIPPPTPLPSATSAPTHMPLPSPTAGCPNPATPEPLWVDPVVSPTDALSQNIYVTLGNGREISITSEAGAVSQQGSFSVAQPVVLSVPLAPNMTNNLVVSGKVEYAPQCFYTLQTRIDRTGKPLAIVQTNAPSPLITAPPVVTAPPPGTVFLKPFSQVVGLNQETPDAAPTIYLYEAQADAPFQILGQQGAFTRLLSQGGALNFWTLNENVVAAPAPEPRIENLTPEQKIEFVQGNIFACEGRAPRGLILGACQEFQDIGQADALQRATVDASILYLVRFNNQTYWVSSRVLKNEPGPLN